MTDTTRTSMADAIVADAGAEWFDDADNVRLAALALADANGCSYSTAKAAVRYAVRRARGEGSTHGGNRGGGRPAPLDDEERRIVDRLAQVAQQEVTE